MCFQTPPEPRVLTGTKETLKWAVGSASGPRSQTWVVKADTNKRGQDSVFIGTRRHMGSLKLSIHESWWQIAFTKEIAPRLPAGTERRLSRFTPPPEIAPGWRRAAVVLIPSTSLSEDSDPSQAESGKVQWWPAPPTPDHLQFHILISEPSADPTIPFEDGAGAVGIIRYGSHRSVAVLATTVVLNDAEREIVDFHQQEATRSRFEGPIWSFAWGEVIDDGTPHLMDVACGGL
jgi:hypothetical protein